MHKLHIHTLERFVSPNFQLPLFLFPTLSLSSFLSYFLKEVTRTNGMCEWWIFFSKNCTTANTVVSTWKKLGNKVMRWTEDGDFFSLSLSFWCLSSVSSSTSFPFPRQKVLCSQTHSWFIKNGFMIPCLLTLSQKSWRQRETFLNSHFTTFIILLPLTVLHRNNHEESSSRKRNPFLRQESPSFNPLSLFSLLSLFSIPLFFVSVLSLRIVTGLGLILDSLRLYVKATQFITNLWRKWGQTQIERVREDRLKSREWERTDSNRESERGQTQIEWERRERAGKRMKRRRKNNRRFSFEFLMSAS